MGGSNRSRNRSRNEVSHCCKSRRNLEWTVTVSLHPRRGRELEPRGGKVHWTSRVGVGDVHSYKMSRYINVSTAIKYFIRHNKHLEGSEECIWGTKKWNLFLQDNCCICHRHWPDLSISKWEFKHPGSAIYQQVRIPSVYNCKCCRFECTNQVVLGQTLYSESTKLVLTWLYKGSQIELIALFPSLQGTVHTVC